jgi:hypothetical protein
MLLTQTAHTLYCLHLGGLQVEALQALIIFLVRLGYLKAFPGKVVQQRGLV